MAPRRYERNQEDWGDPCLADRDPHTRWRVAERPEYATGWSDDAREHVARRSRDLAERSIEEIEDVVAEWAGESAADLAGQFKELASVWRFETKGVPFLITRVAHWAYQRIIGMGPPAVPLILNELAEEPDHWFWALNAITGEDPADGVDSLDEAAERWLSWGHSNGYLK